MYSITQSPSLAVDLARAVQEEHLRDAGRRPTTRSAPRARRVRTWRVQLWHRSPVVAV